MGAAADPVAAVLAAHEAGRDVLLRTSGTSGSAGPVRRTTQSWWASFAPFGAWCGAAAGDRWWVPGDLAATMNLFAAVFARAAGAEVLGPADDAGRATHAALTPAALSRALVGGVLAPGCHALVAGDALSSALAGRAEAAGLIVHHYYGAAELSFVAAGRHRDDLRPFPGVEVVTRGGVLWVRSPYLARDVADADGWASVGDRGALVDGRVVVHGRGDRWATTAGATVDLDGVEATLSDAAGAGGLAVVAVSHPDLGEVVVAVLRTADDLDAVRDRAGSLPRPGRPRRWYCASLGGLPTTPAGKVDHVAVRRAVEDGSVARLG